MSGIGQRGVWLMMVTQLEYCQLLCHMERELWGSQPKVGGGGGRTCVTSGYSLLAKTTHMVPASHKASKKHSPTVGLEGGTTGNIW